MALLAGDEFRLLYAVGLNALVLLASWRFARRFSPDALEAACDAGLLYYLVQYVSVCLVGLLGALHPATIALVAVLLSSALVAAGWRRTEQSPGMAIPGLSKAALVASTLFVLGYVATVIWHQRPIPVISNDAITYHLSAAVQWLQTGRLSFYEAWFYNPANSYSPLAGSAFIAWLMAPQGNDVIARFVAVGPLLLLFVGMISLCRGIGGNSGVAALIAAACVLARPFVSQTILAKDDLFVAAFFILLTNAMRRDRLEQRIGAWRVGIALGLILATKYTALLSMPLVLLMLGRGWNWRRAAMAIACTIVLAGPWYLRNGVMTGNPLYPTDLPFLQGMLHVKRSALLSTPRGAWNVFTAGYYAIPPLGAILLLLGWVGACLQGVTAILVERLRRTVVFGPVIGIAIFVAVSPYGEMRFAYPSIALLFAALALPLSMMPQAVAIAIATALAMLSALSGFDSDKVRAFIGVGAVAACIGIIMTVAMQRGLRLPRRAVAAALLLIALALGAWSYIHYAAYVQGYLVTGIGGWKPYGEIVPAWVFIQKQDPATIAYANTFFTYPLMGPDYRHRVLYVSTRRGLKRFVEMPAIEERVTGEQISSRVIAMLREQPDRQQWVEGIRASGASYLFVGKIDPADPSRTVTPPELVFAREGASQFEPVFENDAASVFKIVPKQ